MTAPLQPDKAAVVAALKAELPRSQQRFEHCQAQLPGCTVRTQDVHHVLGRGKYLLIESTWLAVCRHCHEHIHQNPTEARTRNLLQ